MLPEKPTDHNSSCFPEKIVYESDCVLDCQQSLFTSILTSPQIELSIKSKIPFSINAIETTQNTTTITITSRASTTNDPLPLLEPLRILGTGNDAALGCCAQESPCIPPHTVKGGVHVGGDRPPQNVPNYIEGDTTPQPSPHPPSRKSKLGGSAPPLPEPQAGSAPASAMHETQRMECSATCVTSLPGFDGHSHESASCCDSENTIEENSVKISIISTTPSSVNGVEEISYMTEVNITPPENNSSNEKKKDNSPPGNQTIPADKITGRRIFTPSYLFEQLKKIDRHSPYCSFRDVELVSELRHGFSSTFCFECSMCKLKNYVCTESKNDENLLHINTAVVAGVMGGGGGYSQLNEFAASCNMPSMSSSTYQHHHRKVAKGLEDAAFKQMKEAIEEEKRLAIEAGDVDEKTGIPFITVVCDGGWAKRSYRVNFSSLSGVVSTFNNRQINDFLFKIKKNCKK